MSFCFCLGKTLTLDAYLALPSLLVFSSVEWPIELAKLLWVKKISEVDFCADFPSILFIK